ncbi:MAG TPA: DinB family protein, partial [Gemmatimonadaceae bacterium]|nr:DinB family protein [Gemmatimonadaceae bacterium]
MRRHALILIALALPSLLAAQAPAVDAPRDGVMSAFESFSAIFGSRLRTAFDSIPANRYDYRPTPPQQTIGYIAQHLEDANYALCERMGDLKHPRTAKDSLADTIKARWPKDTLVARLAASFRFCDAAMARIPTLSSGGQARTLLAFETDLAEHYAQLSGYMRQLGMVPPSALPPKPRTAIDLPTSTLTPYVGVYRLDATQELEVTMRDGVLFVKSTGGSTVRLWA